MQSMRNKKATQNIYLSGIINPKINDSFIIVRRARVALLRVVIT